MVGQAELRVAVAHLDARGDQFFARILVLAFAAAARRVQHHADVDAALLGGVRRRDPNAPTDCPGRVVALRDVDPSKVSVSPPSRSA